MQRLYRQDWPGNVRQLRNLIDQLSVLAEQPHRPGHAGAFLPGQPEHTDLGDELADAVLKLPGGDKLELVQDWLTDRALARCNGNKSAAAQLLGVSRKTVERRLKAREAQALELDAQLARGRQAVKPANFAAPFRCCAVPASWHKILLTALKHCVCWASACAASMAGCVRKHKPAIRPRLRPDAIMLTRKPCPLCNLACGPAN